MRRIMVVYGTRPEAIKVAPLITALKESPDFDPIVVVTAQHRSLQDQVNEVFGIEPTVDLDILRPGQNLAEILSRATSGLDKVLSANRPDAVVVQGDTTTTFAGALSAFFHRIPVVHMEAGLRTGDRYSPFPEEINRRLTTHITKLHLAPTATSERNLLAEDVPPEDVVVTGNTVIDALLAASRGDRDFHEPRLRALDEDRRDGRPVVLVTAHRRESWDGGMTAIGRALARIAARERDVRIIFPIHPNPVVRTAVLPHLERHSNVTVTEPLDYGDFAKLLRRAHLVLTDSGGIQEEAPSLGKPVLVMRDTTERPEAVRAGTATLIGTDEGRIVNEVTTLLHSPEAYGRMANATNPYGDGRAAERSVQAVAYMFGLRSPPEAFRPSPEDGVDSGSGHRPAAGAGSRGTFRHAAGRPAAWDGRDGAR